MIAFMPPISVINMSLGSPAASGAPEFSDVAAGKWYSNAIAWAAGNGVVNGLPGNRLDSTGSATRAQAAAVFMRYDGIA